MKKLRLNSLIRDLLLIALILGAGQVHGAEDSAPAIIKGFAQYQAGRIENLILNQFVEDLANERLFKQFFPKTSQAIASYDGISGKRLIPLMQFFFKQDVHSLKKIAKCISTHDRKKEAIENFSLFQKEGYTTETYLKEKVDTIKTGKPSNFCDDTNLYWDSSKKEEFIEEHLDKLKSMKTELIPSIIKDNKAMKSFNKAIEMILRLKEDTPAVIYVHQFFLLLDSMNFKITTYQSFNKFKSAGLFLASLASLKTDAATSDNVDSIIKEFINEEKVYQNKRAETGYYVWRKSKPNLYCNWILCKNTLFLGSYYGIAVDTEKVEARAFGPVGLEWKLLTYRGNPIGVNIAPIDIGAYITNELQGDDYDAKLEDIKAPSYFLSYSLKNKPISFMLGYQENIKTGIGETDDMFFFSIAFDLPIFTIW